MMLNERMKIASVSGLGTGRFLVSSLKSALNFGELCGLRRPVRGGGVAWIEFEFAWQEPGSGEAIAIATNAKGQIVGAETWRLSEILQRSSYANIEQLRRTLNYSHSVESAKECIVSPSGELVAISLEFSDGERFLLAQERKTHQHAPLRAAANSD